jgi:hypothetical protein
MAQETTKSSTATFVWQLAEKYQVRYEPTKSDQWAHHVTRLMDEEVVLDDVENTLVALQRAGHLSRREMVRLQAQYLRETKP